MRQDIDGLKRKIVSFDGQVTGFEASVVQGEFVAGAKESLLLFRDAGVDHYLFFSDGFLWKYARPLSPTDAFSVRASAWVRDQGEPTTRKPDESIVWLGAGHQLRLENRRLVSASDLLVVELLESMSEVEARRKAAMEAAAESSGESELDSYFE